MADRGNNGYYNAGLHDEPIPFDEFVERHISVRVQSEKIQNIRYKYYLISWDSTHPGIDRPEQYK